MATSPETTNTTPSTATKPVGSLPLWGPKAAVVAGPTAPVRGAWVGADTSAPAGQASAQLPNWGPRNGQAPLLREGEDTRGWALRRPTNARMTGSEGNSSDGAAPVPRQWETRLTAQTEKLGFTGNKPSAILYAFMLGIAGLKDFIDLVVNPIPAVGFVVGVCFGIVIFICLMVFDDSTKGTGTGAKKNVAKILKSGKTLRIAALALGTTVDSLIPVLGMLPIETLTVLAMYLLGTHAYRQAKKESGQ
jgi:hypothetical protein